MKLYFERFPDNDSAYQRAEDQWLSPPKEVEPDTYFYSIEATATHPITGESKHYTLSGDYDGGGSDDVNSVKRHFEDWEEDMVWEFLCEEDDPIFSDLNDDDFCDIQIEIDDIHVEINFNEAVHPMEKRIIAEANDNIIEQVEQLIDSIIEKNLETSNFPQLVARSISGYDASWAEKNIDLNAQYKTIKQQFVSEFANSLFANFDKQ